MKDNKSCLRFFFHPDYTVGIGIAPIQSYDSWTLPPVRSCTSPRRMYEVQEMFSFIYDTTYILACKENIPASSLKFAPILCTINKTRNIL